MVLHAIFELLTEESNTKDLLRNYLITLIWATKSVDKRSIKVKVLERWHRLKVYRISFIYYLGDGKKVLFCWKIKSSIGIKLKTTSKWLINKKRLEKYLKLENKKRFVMMIIVENKLEALNFYAKKLKFGEISKVVEKYWEASPSSICIVYFDIGYNQFKVYDKKPVQYVICAEAHKSKNHKYRVIGCKTKKNKIYIYIIAKYANYKDNH